MNDSSSRQRVTTSHVSRPSSGRSSWKSSKPSDCSTWPARAENRPAISSARSAGTVMALILTTDMVPTLRSRPDVVTTSPTHNARKSSMEPDRELEGGGQDLFHVGLGDGAGV